VTAIGIDFGTSNSVAAVWRSGETEVLPIDNPAEAAWESLGFDRVMPSVFAEGMDGSALFGWAAKRSETSRFEAVKRLFATRHDTITDDVGTVFAVEEVATMLFAEIRAAVVRQGIEPQQAVITVPANSRGLARHRTKVCAGMAGFQVLALINEPTAAAMAYSARNPGDQQLLVFDWGGGTLDVTVLRSVEGVFMEEASKGLPTKGGLDFDSRVRKLLLETVPDTSTWTAQERRRFDLEVELAKIKLSNQEFVEVQLPGGESRRVTRAMFNGAVRSLIDEARRPIEQCLADIKAGPGSIDSVVMVGGTSNIPLVRTFVSELLGQEPEAGVDPMTAVGEGAAIAAAILSGQLETNDFFVATEHALGTVVLDSVARRPVFSVLIARNHKLPAKKSERYTPLTPEQEAVELCVIEGDPDAPLDHPDNVILKEWRVRLPGTVGTLDRSFEMTYEYDVDGILHVTVADDATGQTMLEDDVAFGVTDDKRELVRIARRARQTVDSGVVDKSQDAVAAADPEATRQLQQARVKVIPFLDGSEADEVRAAADALEQASPETLEDAKVRLRDVMAPYSYLL
jgi:molecular chaperone DnaK